MDGRLLGGSCGFVGVCFDLKRLRWTEKSREISEGVGSGDVVITNSAHGLSCAAPADWCCDAGVRSRRG